MAWTSPSPGLLTTGAVLIVLGLIIRRAEKRARREDQEWFGRAARAEGVVSRNVDHTQALSRNTISEDESRVIRPVVRFRAANGAEYEVDAPDAPSEIGTPVAIAYDPAIPSYARVVSDRRRLGAGIPLLLIGLGLLVYAFI